MASKTSDSPIEQQLARRCKCGHLIAAHMEQGLLGCHGLVSIRPFQECPCRGAGEALRKPEGVDSYLEWNHMVGDVAHEAYEAKLEAYEAREARLLAEEARERKKRDPAGSLDSPLVQVLKAFRRFDNVLDRLQAAAGDAGPAWLTTEEYGYSPSEFFRSARHIAERLQRWAESYQE